METTAKEITEKYEKDEGDKTISNPYEPCNPVDANAPKVFIPDGYRSKLLSYGALGNTPTKYPNPRLSMTPKDSSPSKFSKQHSLCKKIETKLRKEKELEKKVSKITKTMKLIAAGTTVGIAIFIVIVVLVLVFNVNEKKTEEKEEKEEKPWDHVSKTPEFPLVDNEIDAEKIIMNWIPQFDWAAYAKYSTETVKHYLSIKQYAMSNPATFKSSFLADLKAVANFSSFFNYWGQIKMHDFHKTGKFRSKFGDAIGQLMECSNKNGTTCKSETNKLHKFMETYKQTKLLVDAANHLARYFGDVAKVAQNYDQIFTQGKMLSAYRAIFSVYLNALAAIADKMMYIMPTEIHRDFALFYKPNIAWIVVVEAALNNLLKLYPATTMNKAIVGELEINELDRFTENLPEQFSKFINDLKTDAPKLQAALVRKWT